MFEKFGVPAVFMGRDAVLNCFSLGKTTACSVDIGGTTKITPVTDGWCVQVCAIISNAACEHACVG